MVCEPAACSRSWGGARPERATHQSIKGAAQKDVAAPPHAGGTSRSTPPLLGILRCRAPRNMMAPGSARNVDRRRNPPRPRGREQCCARALRTRKRPRARTQNIGRERRSLHLQVRAKCWCSLHSHLRSRCSQSTLAWSEPRRLPKTPPSLPLRIAAQSPTFQEIASSAFLSCMMKQPCSQTDMARLPP